MEDNNIQSSTSVPELGDILSSSGLDEKKLYEESAKEYIDKPGYIEHIPGRIKRIKKANEQYNWSEIRQAYILGNRVQLEDGTWVSEDCTLKDIAIKFGVNYNYIRVKAANESWSKIRRAYLARVNQSNIGQELGLYTQENYQAEIAAMNACNKLGIVLDKYIDHKFSDILETTEDINSLDSDISEELEAKLNAVNRNTGTPIFVTELKEAIKVASDIYTLQRKIYDNAPKTDMEVIEKITNKPKFKNEKERQAKIQQLQAKLSGVLKPNEIVETVSVDCEID